MQCVEPNPSLQGAVHQLRAALTQCRRRLQDRQRQAGEPQPAHPDPVEVGKRSTPQPNPTAIPQFVSAHRHLCWLMIANRLRSAARIAGERNETAIMRPGSPPG
jgi:hypothetical protein